MAELGGVYTRPDFEGDLIDGELEVSANEKPLGQGKVFLIKIENPLENEDGTNNVVTILWGTQSRQRNRLGPGEVVEWLPISDLRKIWIRSAGKTAGLTTKISWTAIR